MKEGLFFGIVFFVPVVFNILIALVALIWWKRHVEEHAKERNISACVHALAFLQCVFLWGAATMIGLWAAYYASQVHVWRRDDAYMCAKQPGGLVFEVACLIDQNISRYKTYIVEATKCPLLRLSTIPCITHKAFKTFIGPLAEDVGNTLESMI